MQWYFPGSLFNFVLGLANGRHWCGIEKQKLEGGKRGENRITLSLSLCPSLLSFLLPLIWMIFPTVVCLFCGPSSCQSALPWLLLPPGSLTLESCTHYLFPLSLQKCGNQDTNLWLGLLSPTLYGEHKGKI